MIFFSRSNAKVRSYLKKADYISPPCDYCLGIDFDTLSRKDRYGLKVTTVVCKNCGLVFINPRMSGESYEDFYKTGLYRQLLDSYKGKKAPNDKDELKREFNRGRRFGFDFADELSMNLEEGLTLEIGSSCGGILSSLKERFPELNVLGIEPSISESSFANAAGVRTFNHLNSLSSEDLPLASNMLVIRSLNHLSSPREFFTLAHGQLKKEGKLIIVVINFINFCKHRGKVITQVDHPFMFTNTVLRNFVESSGFKIISESASADSDYIKFVAKSEDIEPFSSLRAGKSGYLAVKEGFKSIL